MFNAFKLYLSLLSLTFVVGPSYAIIGGEVTNDYKNVVTIKGITLCGGTIINPYLILTAAHCTHDGRVELNISTKETKKTYKVKKVIPHPTAKFHPSQSTLLKGEDISIIVLDSPIEIPVDAIIPLSSKKDVRLKDNYPIKVIGAGVDESGWPSGVFKSTTTTVSKIPRWKCGGNEKNSFSTKYVARTGDSGGPAYAFTPSGKEVQVGVISREIIFDYMNEYLPQEQQKPSECENKSIYSDVSAHLPWIKEVTGYEPGIDQAELTKKVISKFEINEVQAECYIPNDQSPEVNQLIELSEKISRPKE